jgi:murein DD-endopeptidase MepM/ murein hydrolase activator NlpD
VLRVSLALLALLILPATAAASGSGGTLAGPTAQRFTASPTTVAPGAKVTFALRATPGALVRVDVITPDAPAVRVRLGRVGSSGSVRGAWTAAVAAGKYTARLVVTGAGVTRYYRAPLSVAAPTPTPTPAATPAPATLTGTTTTASKIFPVQGPYSFGGPDARFGVGRPGHIHQGQDIVAAEGTPVVTPIAGTVHWTAFQAAGAGYYVVIAGADGRHYVFMHLQQGSIAVTKGAPVTAGQRVGLVGSTGTASGPHLHFELWVNGWWASNASAPIDPLPELQAWAATT